MSEVKRMVEERQRISRSADVTYDYFLNVLNQAMDAVMTGKVVGDSPLVGLDRVGFLFGLAIFSEHVNRLGLDNWEKIMAAARHYHDSVDLKHEMTGEEDGSG